MKRDHSASAMKENIHARILGYEIELGKYRPGEYTLFTVYDSDPADLGWGMSTCWPPTTVWRTTSVEAVRAAIEAGYPATDEVTRSIEDIPAKG